MYTTWEVKASPAALRSVTLDAESVYKNKYI